MRTVSFSSVAVRNVLTNEFVCHAINTQGDPSAGSSHPHPPGDTPGRCVRGNGRQNVQMLFLTPSGQIFHAASGFRSAEDLFTELRFALAIYRSMQETPNQAVAVVKKYHLARMRSQDLRQEDPFDISFPKLPTFTLDPAELRKSADRLRAQSQAKRKSKSRNGHARWTKDAELGDLRFCIKYPLLPITDFLRNPRSLVGQGTTAFSSKTARGR